MAGNRRDGKPWEKMNNGPEKPRQFHRTEMSGAGRRTYADRFEDERGPRGGRAAGGDRPAGDRRPMGGNRMGGDRRPGGNPPRTGGYRPVPKAVFDDGPKMEVRRPAPKKPMPVPPPPPAEPPKDPVLRNAAMRAARPMPFPPAEQEIPENLLVGRNPIREAIKTGHAIEKLLVAKGDLSGAARDIVRMALERGVVVQEVERVRLDQIYRNHQGMLAYIAMAEYSTVEDMFAKAEAQGEEPFLIILDGITDPHNLGAIIRSAECTGAHGVIIPERRSVGLTPAAVKAAAGATEYMPVAKVTNINRLIEELQQRGVWVMASAMDGESIYDVDLSGSVALVIGSEGDGVSALTLKKCDRVVSLPMKGHIDSLNASVAAGAMMYAVLQQRG